jgi:hypothetical protein
LLVGLLAMFVVVATTDEQAEAVDVARPVEGETFDGMPAGTKVVTDTTLYSNSQALKFTDNTATATETVDFGSQGDVVLVARGGQSGGSSTLSVRVDDGAFSPAQRISNNGAPAGYTYDLNVPTGRHTISVRAGNTSTGRYPFLDYVTFPTSGSGGTDPGGDIDKDGIPDSSDNCPTVYNPGQRDDDGDNVGNKCESGSTSPTDTDGDGVADSTDQCPTESGPASNNGCPVTTPPTDWNCSGTPIKPGNDIDNIINSAPPDSPTTFCVYAGRYPVSQVARLKTGDTLSAQPGKLDYVGPATDPTPVVELYGTNGTDNLLSTLGADITIKWVDLTGASGTGTGTGSAIAAGSADSDLLVQFARIHNNDSVGISNAKGRILDSEFFSNSQDPNSIGFNASAIKGITQFEAGRLYVHDEQGNGIWCDVGCGYDSKREHGFWVYDSVVVGGNRAGIRYENSPTGALFEDNWVRGNGKLERRGGIDIRDSQHAIVKNNVFGDNGDQIGVRATDSGRSDRVNLFDISVTGNDMNGERIVSCGGQVACSLNTQ